MLCRAQLDAIHADQNAPNLTVHHTLTRVEGDVAGDNVLRGRVNIEMLQSLNFPEPSEETLIFSCGP